MINRNELTEYQKGRFDVLCDLEAHLEVSRNTIELRKERTIIHSQVFMLDGVLHGLETGIGKITQLKKEVNGSTSEIGTRLV